MKRPCLAMIVVLILALFSCRNVPQHAPQTPIQEPSGNHGTPSPALRELGRMLFYDTRLSLEKNLACSSCHRQEHAFASPEPLPMGTRGEPGLRNAPGLVNLKYARAFTWANPRFSSLEDHAVVPLFGENPRELGLTSVLTLRLAELSQDERYQHFAISALGKPLAHAGVPGLVAALGAFVGSMESRNAPYDKSLAGDENALGPAARRGRALFEGTRFGCANCHGGELQSNAFVVPQDRTRVDMSTLPWKPSSFAIPFLAEGGNTDLGLASFTGQSQDEGAFRIPSLRNVTLTAPYLHDGRLASLEGVLAVHRAQGTPAPDAREQHDLLAFLTSLADQSFVEEDRFSNPFTHRVEILK